jgi:hypothetical protein
MRPAGDYRREPTDAGERFWAEGFSLTGMALTVRQACWRYPVDDQSPHLFDLFPGRLLTLA